MQEKNLNRIGEVCFWIGLVIECILVMIDKSAYINPYEGQLFRVTFLLFCIKIATTKYTKKEWMCMIGIGIIALISYLVNDKDEVVRAVTFITSCKNISLKKECKVILGITAVGSILLFLLSISGIYGNLTITANFGRGPFPGIVETRYCFGMGHPNAFQCMILMMTMLTIYIYINGMKWFHFILLLLGNYISFYFTDSNTGFLVSIAVICGSALLKYCSFLREKKKIYILSSILILTIVIFSAIGSQIGRETPFMYNLDQILNGRFQYAHVVEQARLCNWKLFSDVNNVEYFDQGFIRLFYWYGIVPGVVYVLGNLFLIVESYKQKDYVLTVMIVGLCVFMLMEAHVISYYILRNYIFVWLGYYWHQLLQESKEKSLLSFMCKR